MTQSFAASVTNLVVPSGQSVSNAIEIENTVSDAISVSVYAGTGATAGTFEVSPDSGVTYYTVQDSTPADIPTPLATKVRSFTQLSQLKGRLRVRLASAPGSDVTFVLTKNFTS